uniref:Uncharacterized protein n=1 Tax=Panagrolaimus sp. JU765 TaxID=591449 RepID=A0AC34QCM3_9BILA
MDCFLIFLPFFVFDWLKLIQGQQSPFDNLAKFSFEKDDRFIKVVLPVFDEEASVFGSFETSESVIVFELLHDLNLKLLNLPADDVKLSILNATKYCSGHGQANGSIMNFEIEIENYAITVRSKNSEAYPFKMPLLEHEHFRLLFFAKNDKDLCVLPAITKTSNKSEHQLLSSPSESTSEFNVIRPSTRKSRFNGFTSTQTPGMRRTATMRSAFAGTTRHSLRYATYKKTNTATTDMPFEVPYIDISKDRKTYEEVKRSITNEINSAWSPTFFIFFSIEIFIVSIFTIFGLTMFVCLQLRPKNYLMTKPVIIE